MTTITTKHFDSLNYVKQAKKLGTSEELAELQARQIEQAIDIAVATIKDEMKLHDLATKKDISSGPSLIAAVGAKYKQNPTTDIARFKKSFVDNNPTNTPISWRAMGGNIAKSKTVGKDYKTYP